MTTPLRLLMVEDSEDDALLLLRELRNGGFEPEHRRVQAPQAFLDALQTERWDIVLSDYEMPDFDGLAAFKLMRERGHDVPFIFVSGHIGEERAVEAMRHGVSDYLHKDRLGRLVPAINRELADAQARREQRETAEALRASEARLRRVTQNAPDIIYEYAYLPHPHFSFVSPAVEAVTGHAAAEFYADAELWLRIAHPDDRERLAELLRPTAPPPPAGEIVRLHHRDGRLRWVEQRIVPLYDEGRLVGTEGIVRDVTDRKELEAQLLAAQRMESLGRLAGGIAHDFNNMLTVIGGYCSLLRRKLEQEGAHLHEVERIENATQRAAALVRQLLTFSRRQPRNLQRLDLSTVLSEFGPMLERVIGDDIRVELRATERLPPVRADRSQIEQILMNLVVNARDAMPEGGRLVIETDVVRMDEPVLPRTLTLRSGRHVRLVVTDTGSGMDEAVLARIFDPFFTTKEVGKGTGLGLSTVYGIVKQMDGDIWVYSEPGLGTTFKLYFPCEDGFADPPPPLPDDDGMDGQGLILLVEDETMVREATEEILRAHGYQVLAASSGMVALQVFQERGAQVDLLLTDLLMPGMSGLELAQQVLALRPDLRVLYTTGYTEAALPETLSGTDPLPVLQKPYGSRELLLRVRALLSAEAPAIRR